MRRDGGLASITLRPAVLRARYGESHFWNWYVGDGECGPSVRISQFKVPCWRWPGSSTDEPTYALEGLINYSSATIAWLKDQLGLITDAAESETLADQVEDNGGVYLVPAFAGLSAPHWNAEARAAILGMSGHTTKAHILRAALESISYQIRDVLDMIQC